MEKQTGDLEFSFQVAKNGEVSILRHGHVVTILRAATAREFLGAMEDAVFEDQQQLMARATGNYKRGNERLAARHPRNRSTPKRPPPVPETVDDFLAALDHPCKPEILAVRKTILGADAGIAEDIKWNAPSFRTTEYFATFHLRAREGVQLILHFGAKARTDAIDGASIDDPAKLLKWLGKDRASVSFADLADIAAKRKAFAAIVRQWIALV